MQKLHVLFICLLLFAIVNFTFSQTLHPAKRREASIKALKGIKMDLEDLSINHTQKPDTFRLQLVDKLLEKPIIFPDTLDKIAKNLGDAENNLNLFFRTCGLLDINVESPKFVADEITAPWKGEVALPNDIKSALNSIYSGFLKAQNKREEAFAEIDSFRFDTLQTSCHKILLEEEPEKGKDRSLEEIDNMQQDERNKTHKIFNIAKRVNYNDLALSSSFIINSVIDARNILNKANISNIAPGNDTLNIEGARGDIIYSGKTKFGRVIIGGPEQTIYEAEAAIIIDIGGDDIYNCSAGGARDSIPFAVVLDLEGDDFYSSNNSVAFGSGFTGTGVLYDMNGDDTYKSDNYSLGSGILGTGLLYDESGNDQYIGDSAIQGAGFLGWGFLVDNQGNDTYSGNLYCQGFGYVKGMGLLLDSNGDDLYRVEPKYPDKLRDETHYYSFSQGFGFGSRPDFSGGIGLIVDEKGNDNYYSDIFGQGASYWFSLGAIIDFEGDDHYKSYRYSQGAGIHFSVGLLLDYNGNDSYVSHLVSQGCGHDLGVGFLADINGNDKYTTWSLSQGAGNANGIGILSDQKGDDSYITKNKMNTRGYGEFNRGYGSIGMFLDLEGDDSYAGRGNNSSWWSHSKYGISVDFPTEIPENKETESDEE